MRQSGARFRIIAIQGLPSRNEALGIVPGSSSGTSRQLLRCNATSGVEGGPEVIGRRSKRRFGPEPATWAARFAGSTLTASSRCSSFRGSHRFREHVHDIASSGLLRDIERRLP